MGNSNTGTCERVKYETPRPEAVITRNGQVIPADEGECSADVLPDDEIGTDEPGAMQSYISATVGSVHKRKAGGDLAIDTAANQGGKTKRTRQSRDSVGSPISIQRSDRSNDICKPLVIFAVCDVK